MTDIAMVVPLANRIARLALLQAGETTTKLRLFKSAFTVDETTVLADLTAIEADCDGYTAGGFALTYTSGYITPELVPSDESNLVSIIMPDPVVTGNTIYGGFITNVSGLLMCFNLPTPVPLVDPGNALKLMIENSYPPGLPSVQIVP